MRLIILAAGMGTRLAPLTDNRPKCLVPFLGRPLLEWQILSARKAGITDITVVGGYQAEQLRHYDVDLVINPDFATTNMVQSLFCAQNHFGRDFIMSYGDIVCDPTIFDALLRSRDPVSVASDREWLSYWQNRFDDPLSDATSFKTGPGNRILELGQAATTPAEIAMQYIGLVRFQKEGVRYLERAYETARISSLDGTPPFGGKRSFAALYLTDMLQGMIGLGYPVHAAPISGQWFEVDTDADLALAEKIAHKRLPGLPHPGGRP